MENQIRYYILEMPIVGIDNSLFLVVDSAEKPIYDKNGDRFLENKHPEFNVVDGPFLDKYTANKVFMKATYKKYRALSRLETFYNI